MTTAPDTLHLSDEEGLDDNYDSCTEENGSSKELLAGLKLYAQDIIKKIHDGKSVTRRSKEDIVKAAQKILSITKQLETQHSGHRTPVSTNKNIDNDDIISRVRSVVREEVAKICVQPPPTPVPKPTFALVTQRAKDPNTNQSPPTSKPALIVSSVEEVRCPAETMQKWRKAINFKNTNYSPASVRFVSNNKIRVEFDTKQQRDETISRINTENSEITAESSKVLNPMVTMKGISKDTSPDSLVETILNQNDYIKDLNDHPSTTPITLKFIKNNRNTNLYNAVFMTSPRIFHAMLSRGRVNVDHQRVHIEEHIPLLQCFHCLQFGHTKNRCPNEHPACSHCAAQTHTFKDCPVKNDAGKTSCINCTLYYKKHKIDKNPPNHSATSNLCPRIAQMNERLRTKIDYGQ